MNGGYVRLCLVRIRADTTRAATEVEEARGTEVDSRVATMIPISQGTTNTGRATRVDTTSNNRKMETAAARAVASVAGLSAVCAASPIAVFDHPNTLTANHSSNQLIFSLGHTGAGASPLPSFCVCRE